MPFRCKCGKTFEKVESFSSHTSGCAPFHQRRVSTSEVLSPKQLSIDTDVNKEPISHVRRLSSILSPIYSKGDYFFGGPAAEQNSSTPKSAPIIEGERRYSFMMPTALSIQNTFEGVQRRRSMSGAASNAATAAYK